MNLLTDSITIVLLGDWNRLYIQPDWVATKVFGSSEIEIGIEGKDTDFHISYKKGNVIIRPAQNKIVLSATDSKKEIIDELVAATNNYLKNAFSPQIFAYGINIDFQDSENTSFADALDNMPDAEKIVELGYKIETSQIQRTFSKDGNTINMKIQLGEATTKVHFNEHHEDNVKGKIKISTDSILSFIDSAKNILSGLGYEIDGENYE